MFLIGQSLRRRINPRDIWCDLNSMIVKPDLMYIFDLILY